MLIQIHILQNYAPANLNRDDTGSPKDAIFGGLRRGRISSQCLKRSIRRSTTFAEYFSSTNLLGMRTRLLPQQIKEALVDLQVPQPVIDAIVSRVPEIGRESAKGESNTESQEGNDEVVVVQTRQLIFIGANEIKPLAQKLLEIFNQHGVDKWKKAKIADITKELGASLPKSVDIAMFGRMTTSEAFEDVQASVQVAHAISTNALTEEFDYYTAVDDLSGETGAGMIGDVEFNSSTYYKYLNIHWEQLVKNLAGDKEIAKQAVKALIKAATIAHPTGKQNSFAAFNLPDLVLVEVSESNLPVSYANAFLKPVRSNHQSSIMDISMDQLASHMDQLIKTYDLSSQRAFITTTEHPFQSAQQQTNVNTLIDWAVGFLA